MTVAPIAAALAASALVVGGLAAAAPVATAAPTTDAPSATAKALQPRALQPRALQPRALKKESFTVFGKFTSRQQVKYGNANGVGNLTVTQGTVTDIYGKKAGTLTTVMRVVAPSPKKDAELRDTQSQVLLKGGQIFAQAVNEDPKEGAPKTLHIMTVTGGTGAYASARGTLIIYPMGDKYRMAYDIFVEKDLKASTFAFDTITQEAYDGSGAQGIGDVSLLHATGTDDSYILIATRAGDAKGIVTDTVDMQVFTGDGSLFARTIARSKSSSAQASTFAVLGGTGVYAGYRGELTLSPSGKAVTAKLAKPAGTAKPLTWWEDGGRTVTEATIPGGTFLGAEGYMFKTANTKAKKSGDYFATLLTYDDIDGITPVVGMIEQEFKTGTMIITGITLANTGTPALRPIAGGTGDYGGAGGQAASLEISTGVWKKSARFWR